VSGRIGLRLVDPGNFVTMGDATGICVITQMQPMSVLFTIPEDSLPQVRQRLREGAKLPVTALDRAQKNQLAEGVVSTTDNQIDTTTGTVRLRAIFDNADEALFPNQFVNIRLLADTVKDAVTVPVAAVQRGQPGTFVYLVKSDDTVGIRVIETGATDGEKIAITKGLAVGDEVVVDGVDRLRDGAKIRRPNRQAGERPVAAAPDGSAPKTDEAKPPAQGQRHGGGERQGAGGERRGGGSRTPAQTNQ
jgi:multidrug efflux system membrane fusion protein